MMMTTDTSDQMEIVQQSSVIHQQPQRIMVPGQPIIQQNTLGMYVYHISIYTL